MNIRQEYTRFVKNFDFNEGLALETKKPHLARRAYGACEEWIKDFQESIEKTTTMYLYGKVIAGRKQILQKLKEKLRKKFNDNKTLMGMLK